jgi:hypothetical protein
VEDEFGLVKGRRKWVNRKGRGVRGVKIMIVRE